MDLVECDAQDKDIVDVDIAVEGEDIVEGEVDVESDFFEFKFWMFRVFILVFL